MGRALNPGGSRGNVSHSIGGRIDWPLSLSQGKPFSKDALVRRPRRSKSGELWLIVVDASASTRRHQALMKAKGVLGSILMAAYQDRIQIALVQASGVGPSWRALGKKPPKYVAEWIENIDAGGGTPLKESLIEAKSFLNQRCLHYPHEKRRIFILTDGRIRDLPAVEFMNTACLLIDIESGPIRLGRAHPLATHLGATYVHIDTLPEY